jgi:Mrp family chromosome partitioning ATPase
MINIPYQNMEIEKIYTQIFSEQGRAIAICSANSGEGVTSLAFALAQRNLLAGHSTLLVDLNLYRPALQEQLNINELSNNLPCTLSQAILATPQLVSVNNNLTITGITAPSKREHIIKLRQPGVLKQCINEWLKEYDCVLIDTSPLNRVNAQNIPAEQVAAACDGTILSVLTGQTSEVMISNAVNKLNTSKATILGCVFNDRDNPSLKNELLREVQRFGKRFPWLNRKLTTFIHNNHLLTLDI